MRKFPVPKVAYEVWYLDNVETDAESWRHIPAVDYPNALTVIESLTKDIRPKLRNTQIYVIEVSRRAVAEQFNDYTT